MRLEPCPPWPQRAGWNDKNQLVEPADHALGRSRGGWTTKIHALTDELCSPVTMLLSAGQDGDSPMLMPLLKAHDANNADELGRLLADKAYSHPSTRTRLRSLKIKNTIPERSDQIGRRKAKGSAGGRPPAFDSRMYLHRNAVERGFNRLKTIAQNREPLRQIRPDLPRRRHPRRHRDPPPRPQLTDTP